MVAMMRRRGRRRGERQAPAVDAAVREYAELGWPVCPGSHRSRGPPGTPEPGRACSCDRVGCPAPGAHPVSPTWQMQATVDGETIRQCWEARPEGTVFPAAGGFFVFRAAPGGGGATALSA